MPLCVLLSPVQVSRPVCVDVPSETEAVVGNPMKLTCISCMKREEVNAETRVDWYYIPPDKESIPVGLLHLTSICTNTNFYIFITSISPDRTSSIS